jgi:hypothetical protein
MKTKIYLAVLAAGVLSFSSCSDVLEEDPKGRLSAETFFSSEDDLDMAVNAMFYQLMLTGQSDGRFNFEWEADDITTHPQSNKANCREFDKFVVSDNGSAGDAWGAFYGLVKACNFVINNAERTPTSTETVEQAIGQARFWRAYAYYYLVRMYGPIPVMLEEEINYEAALTPVAEVFNLIVEDLKYAESKLPANWTTSPKNVSGCNVYATDGAAKSMLAHVYLSMAGWPLKQTSYYAQSAAKAKEVIDGVASGKYNYILEANYEDIYKMSNQYSNENIISIHYNKAWGWDENSMSTLTGLFESAGGGWSDFWGEIKFWHDMPDGPRKDAIYAPKVYQSATGELVDWWETWENHPMVILTGEGPNGTDYDWRTGAVGCDWLGEKSHKVFRYAELLLTYAEAQARAEGTPNALAYECVNQVRRRAGLEDLAAGLSGSEFAAAVVAEHGWEVGCYFWNNIGARVFDMQRLELLEDHFNYRKQNPEIEVAPGIYRTETIAIEASAWNDNMMYVPYPAGDKVYNPNLVR